MTVNIGVITSAIVTQEELSAFVRDMGSEVFAKRSQTGHLQFDNADIWVQLAPENLAEAMRDDQEAIVSKLGDTPRSMIDIGLSSDEGSDKLALKFVASFMERWPTIMDDSCGGFHSREELLEFQVSGQPLWKLRDASLERAVQDRI